MHILHNLSHHPDFAMAVHWSERWRMLPSSLSFDWQPDGTEAGWNQCPTSRRATHQKEMRKGETHTICMCVCVCWQRLWWILHLQLCVWLWYQHERKEEIKIGFDRWKNDYRLIFSPMDGWINRLMQKCINTSSFWKRAHTRNYFTPIQRTHYSNMYPSTLQGQH